MIELVDAHAHITRGIHLREVIGRMDAAGVRSAAIMAREVDESRILELRRLAPGRIIPFLGGRLFQAALQRGSRRSLRRGIRHYLGFQKEWWDRDGASVFRRLETALKSGRFGGIGEIRLKHRGFGPKVPEMKCHYDFEADHPIVLRLLEIAGSRRLPVTVHLEIDEDRASRLRAFSRALDLRPKTRVLWAHAGPADAATLERMMARHRNLSAEIMPLLRNTYKEHVPYLRTFPPMTTTDGKLRSEWKKLLERRADRFVFGSDCRTVAEYKHLKVRADDMRAILARLSAAAARKIAVENARSLFREYRKA